MEKREKILVIAAIIITIFGIIFMVQDRAAKKKKRMLAMQQLQNEIQQNQAITDSTAINNTNNSLDANAVKNNIGSSSTENLASSSESDIEKTVYTSKSVADRIINDPFTISTDLYLFLKKEGKGYLQINENEKEEKAKIKINAISIKGQSKMVMIGNKIYQKGDFIEGMKLLEIYEDKILLDNDGEKILIRMGE